MSLGSKRSTGLQQHYRMTGNTLFTASKSEFFCGGGFNIDTVDRTVKVSSQIEAHLV
jgi:hypothetical protein